MYISYRILFLLLVSCRWILQRTLDANLLQLLDEFSVLVHLKEDIAAPDKLTVQVDLWDCGPVAKVLDSCKER